MTFMIKHDLTAGFPDPWIGRTLEVRYSAALYKKFFGRDYNGMLVNMTWSGISSSPKETRSKLEETVDLIKEKEVDRALFFNFIDNFGHEWLPVINQAIEHLGRDNVKVVGHTPGFNDYEFSYWAQFVYHNFLEYSEDDLKPGDLKNRYLCYNRKPHGHRVRLFEQFHKDNLLNKGIFTLGSEDRKGARSFKNNGPGVNKTIIAEPDAHGIPIDLISLGNLGAWRNSFLVIVTETGESDHDDEQSVFITEKTFKPIVGKRPFLSFGTGPNFYSWMKEHGFVTFNKYFNLPDRTLNEEEISNAVQQLEHINLGALYNEMKEDIEHNYANFKKHCELQDQKIFQNH